MIDIQLEGLFGAKFGQKHRLEVSSIMEIFHALEANGGLVEKNFKDLTKFVKHFVVYIDDKIMPAHLVANKKILENKKEVKIVPIVQGGGVALIIAGLVLIALSVVLSIVLSPKAPKDVKTNSTILGGIRNVTSRNIVVPIGYGRLRVGSAVIANDIRVFQILENSDTNISAYFDYKNNYGSDGFYKPVSEP
jgi:predicted phage tail protein